MNLDFTNQVVLVTGAGQGNGAAIAKGFAAAGAHVVLIDRNVSHLNAVAREIDASGGKQSVYQLDVSSPGACKRIARTIATEIGDVGVLVNNAGILLRGALDAEDALDKWDSTIDVNLGGPYYMALAFLDALRRTKGCILNVCSVQSFVASINSISYISSKGGIRLLTQALAAELASDGIRVNAIAPGLMATPMTEATRSDPSKMATVLTRVPMRRAGQPEELVGPSLFLCSQHASYITGAILPVDGGHIAF
jgi:NAD(P)-dependent dehydrogenase (short-subunit alcohol dehydrogenase family)